MKGGGKLSLFLRLTTLLCSVLIIIPVGCQTNNKTTRNQITPNAPRKISYQTTEQMRRNQSTRPKAHKTADRLVHLATSVPGVKGATAIVAGRYTLVGIDVDPNLDRGRVGTIKYSVAQALKKDPHGKNALVSADVDIVHRIRELNKQIMKGKPLAGLTNELAAIAGRIAPQPSGTK